MKLLFIVEHFREMGTGLENSAIALCRAMAARGHDVHVLTDNGQQFDGVAVHFDGLNSMSTVCSQVKPAPAHGTKTLYDLRRILLG